MLKDRYLIETKKTEISDSENLLNYSRFARTAKTDFFGLVGVSELDKIANPESLLFLRFNRVSSDLSRDTMFVYAFSPQGSKLLPPLGTKLEYREIHIADPDMDNIPPEIRRYLYRKLHDGLGISRGKTKRDHLYLERKAIINNVLCEDDRKLLLDPNLDNLVDDFLRRYEREAIDMALLYFNNLVASLEKEEDSNGDTDRAIEDSENIDTEQSTSDDIFQSISDSSLDTIWQDIRRSRGSLNYYTS